MNLKIGSSGKKNLKITSPIISFFHQKALQLKTSIFTIAAKYITCAFAPARKPTFSIATNTPTRSCV
jgi:hypothetical protein